MEVKKIKAIESFECLRFIREKELKSEKISCFHSPFKKLDIT